MSARDPDTILAAARTGIYAVVAEVDAADPGAPTPCERWTVHDLVRHLEAIAGAYLLWTGSAVGGRIARMRVGDDLARYNELMLQRLPRVALPVHARRFEALATDHVRLARATWEMPMLETPDDVPLDVGQHAGITAVEWHVHAWDLARARGRDHVPDDLSLDVVLRVWDDTLGAVTGAVRDPQTDDAWAALLVATGRTP